MSPRKNSKKKPCDWRKHQASRLPRRARELSVSDSALHGWRKELAEHGEEALEGEGASNCACSRENRRLKREVERLQQERDILKSSEHLLAGIQMRISVY
jgi:transposase-like protein